MTLELFPPELSFQVGQACSRIKEALSAVTRAESACREADLRLALCQVKSELEYCERRMANIQKWSGPAPVPPAA